MSLSIAVPIHKHLLLLSRRVLSLLTRFAVLLLEVQFRLPLRVVLLLTTLEYMTIMATPCRTLQVA